MRIPQRFPAGSDIFRVFALSSFIIYAWTIIASFRLLAISWILFMSVGEILGLLAYQVLTAFLECAIVTCALLLLGGVLPRRFLWGQFAVRGSILAFGFLGSLMVYYQFFLIQELLDKAVYWLAIFLTTAGLLMWLAHRFQTVRHIVAAFAERCLVFGYLSLPLAALSLLVVVYRNL